MPDRFTVSDLSQLTRKIDRGSHNAQAVYDILDTSIVCPDSFTSFTATCTESST